MSEQSERVFVCFFCGTPWDEEEHRCSDMECTEGQPSVSSERMSLEWIEGFYPFGMGSNLYPQEGFSFEVVLDLTREVESAGA